jgi:hypothetical protein
VGAGKGAWTGATKYFGVPRPGLRGTTPGGMATGAPIVGVFAATAGFAAEALAGAGGAGTAFDAGRGAALGSGAGTAFCPDAFAGVGLAFASAAGFAAAAFLPAATLSGAAA